MTDDDNEARRDESERDSLQKTISDVETALAGSTAGARAVLEIFLLNARGRVAALDKKIKDSQVEKEKHAKEVVEAVSLAQKESALNSQEKETFSGFLKEEFFTKKDFARLDQFYAHTWDRLSDGGKDEMSHRIWEGIRRDEYTFTELPKVVQEKEAERVSRQLTDSSITTSSTARISEKDRKDFLTTYGAGRREEAFEILDRRSFRENMFLGESRENQHTDASKGKEADGNAIADKASVKAAKAEKPKPLSDAVAMRELNLASVDLSGMNAGGGATELSAAEIPRAGDSLSKSR